MVTSLQSLPHAAEVLNANGSIKTTGPHIQAAAVQWVRDRKTGKPRAVVIIPRPTATAQGVGAAPTLITPGNPPDIGSTTNYAANSLWGGSATASDQDINQLAASDCYFLATLDSLNRQAYGYISQLLTRRSDGMNLATYRRNLLAPVTVATDSLIGDMFARPNPVTGAVEGPVWEKTYAYFRTGANTMKSEDYGFPGFVMTDLGVSNVMLSANGIGIAVAMIATLAGGFPLVGCTFGTIPNGIPIDYAHAYSVLKVWIDASGQVWLIVRNPWGINGQGSLNPPNSQITITLQQFAAAFSVVSAGTKYAADVTPSPLPTPTPTPTPTPEPTMPPTISLSLTRTTVDTHFDKVTANWTIAGAVSASYNYTDSPAIVTAIPPSMFTASTIFDLQGVSKRTIMVKAVGADGTLAQAQQTCYFNLPAPTPIPTPTPPPSPTETLIGTYQIYSTGRVVKI